MINRQQAKILADFESDLRRRKAPSTVSQYLRLGKRFLEYTDGDFSRRKLLDFIDRVSAGNKGYYRWIYYVSSKLYKSMDVKFPLDEDDLVPMPSESEMNRPVIGISDVERLIAWTKRRGFPHERAYLALSTTYGFRLSEMGQLTSKNFRDNTITVDTLKHGERRIHTIPEEIQSQLHFPFRSRTQPTMNNMFNTLCIKAHVERQKGTGFHAIRRPLDTYLILNGVPIIVVKRWFGWKSSSLGRIGMGMPGHYFTASTQELDSIIFEKHPFLKFWGA